VTQRLQRVVADLVDIGAELGGAIGVATVQALSAAQQALSPKPSLTMGGRGEDLRVRYLTTTRGQPTTATRTRQR
jgi:hypothetical protein